MMTGASAQNIHRTSASNLEFLQFSPSTFPSSIVLYVDEASDRPRIVRGQLNSKLEYMHVFTLSTENGRKTTSVVVNLS